MIRRSHAHSWGLVLVLLAFLCPSLSVAQIISQGGLVSAPIGLTTQPTQQFQTYDGTIQFNFGYTPNSVQWWSGQGGLAGMGATIYATNGNAAGGVNVNGNFVTQNAGNFFFATGNGIAAEIADPGAAATAYPVITPGTSALNPIYGSTGNTQIDAPAGSTGYLTNGGLIMASFKNSKGIVANGNYPQFFGATGAVGLQCVNVSGSGAVNCFFQAQSTGTVSFGNSSGSLATFSNSDANTAVDFVSFKASSSTDPIRIAGGAGTSVAIGGKTLAANATAGFAMIPNCPSAGGPTGVPALLSGYAPICYNPTTHTWNVYDSTASSWYHITLTAGAG